MSQIVPREAGMGRCERRAKNRLRVAGRPPPRASQKFDLESSPSLPRCRPTVKLTGRPEAATRRRGRASRHSCRSTGDPEAHAEKKRRRITGV